ncbi:MAG: adenylosuccinate lyase [Roseovarius sp.]
MKSKTILTSLALVLASSLSAAAMCPGKSHQAASCADGMVWDKATGTCVEQTIS